MFRTGRRLIAVFLIFAMLTGSVCAVSPNSAARHDPGASLSEAAKAYYIGTYSFRRLCSTPGMDASSDKAMGSYLFVALHDRMSTTLTTNYSYESLPQYWYLSDTDSKRSGLILFYSDVFQPKGGYLVREHVWAKSHGTFYETGAGSDLHHLRPENYDVNDARSNYTFGNVRSKPDSYAVQSYDGKPVLWYNKSYSKKDCRGLVEVADDVKGDVARILLYVYVTYKQPNLTATVPAFDRDGEHSNGRKVIEDLDTLLEWCRRDPVDAWEMQRNDVVQQLQGNRNVFIDYPELAWLLFDKPLPYMQTPSGYAKQNSGSDFVDVPINIWYREGLNYVVKEGLMNGIGHRRFAPDGTLTRAQLATVLYRLAGSPGVIGARNPFSDIKNKTTWYTNAVLWANQQRIMQGYPDGTFRPDEAVTREQLVTVLYRYRGAKPGRGSALLPFPDRGQVSDFARDAMCWAVEQGIINGNKISENLVLLAPKDGTTRAQFSVIMQRWMA